MKSLFSFSTAQAKKISWKELGKARFVVWCHEQDTSLEISSKKDEDFKWIVEANLHKFALCKPCKWTFLSFLYHQNSYDMMIAQPCLLQCKDVFEMKRTALLYYL